MDDQTWNQFVNEQSLINMSVIEQLNEQSQYLNAIVERLDIIYQIMNPENQFQQMETKPMNSLNLDTSRAKGMLIGSTNNDQKPKPQEPQPIVTEEVPKPTEIPVKETEITVEEAGAIEDISYEISRTILFGDRIQVITKNMNKSGVFIELDNRYIVWVIDEGRLTFTDLSGTTIIKLS